MAKQKKITNLADLTPDNSNANKGTERGRYLVEASLTEVGAGRSILVDAAGNVIAGNKTLEAWASMGGEVEVVQTDGHKLVVVQRTDLDLHDTTGKARKLAYYDNRAGQVGLEWDTEQLLADVNAGVDLSSMFKDDELKELLADVNGGPVDDADAEPQTDRAEELRAQWGTETGQLWRIGEHRLLCGDSTKREDVERVMGGEKADVCFTSPPYGAGNTAKLRDHYVKGAKDRESFYDEHKDNPNEWAALMDGWYSAFKDVSECIVCNVQMLADNKRHLLKWVFDNSDTFVDVIIWNKGSAAPQMQKNVLSNAFEFCFVFGGNGSRAIPFAEFHGNMSNVINIGSKGKNDFSDVHRAVMPLDLPLYVIGELCKRSQIIAEPFAGSGTTLVACQQLGRKCRAVEISPAYCAVILERMKAAFPLLEIELCQPDDRQN